MRTLTIAFGSLLAAGVAAPAAAFHPNDYTPRYHPYFGQPYRTVTYQPKRVRYSVDYVYYKQWKKKRPLYSHRY